MSKIITNRQEIAKVLNFGKYPVLSIDLDKMERDYEQGSKCRLLTKFRNGEEFLLKCQLYMEGDKVALSSTGSMLTSDFTVYDFIELSEYAQTPIIKGGDIVAVCQYSRKTGLKVIELMKVSDRIDIHCIEVVRLEEIEE